MKHRTKINDDIRSIKVWLIFISVALLVNHNISDTVWASLTTALLGLRSWDEFGHNVWGSVEQTVKQGE